jgi:hypothetical protein
VSYYGPGCNNRPARQGHVGGNHAIRTDPNVVLDDYLTTSRRLETHRNITAHVVIGSAQYDVRRDHDPITDDDFSRRGTNLDIRVNRTVVTDANSPPLVRVKVEETHGTQIGADHDIPMPVYNRRELQP